MSDYQLIVIGAGPGGYTAALEAARLGLHTAVVERREVGGTCLNRGCIPTKAMLHAAEVYENAKNAEKFGVSVENVSFDFGKIHERRQAVVEKLRTGVEALFAAHKIDLYRGQGQLQKDGSVSVTDAIRLKSSSNRSSRSASVRSRSRLRSAFRTKFRSASLQAG